jgi:DNA-binding transcriptional ArsR family regulator
LSDGLAASDISEQFTVSPQAISQHLKILRESNWLHMEKRAQQRIYRVNPDAVGELESWTQGVRRRWNRRLDALDVVLQEEKQKIAQKRTKEEDSS